MTKVSAPSLASRPVPAAVAGLALAVALAACGSGSSKPSTASAPTTAAGASGAGAIGGASGGRVFPGASGSVAAINGTSMEVQNPASGQTTVDWTGSTRFTRVATVTAAALTPGACVTVVGQTTNGVFTARTVSIAPAVTGGSCPGPGAFFGRPGGFRAGFGPSGSSPSGSLPAPGARRAFAGTNAGLVAGQVVSVQAPTLVVHGSRLNGFRFRSSSTSVPPTTTAGSDISVTLAATTVYSETSSTTASALAVGDCVVANGSADSTGAIAARAVRITSTGGQSCPTTGFGLGGGAAPGGGTVAGSGTGAAGV